jgi:hypothetical protein
MLAAWQPEQLQTRKLLVSVSTRAMQLGSAQAGSAAAATAHYSSASLDETRMHLARHLTLDVSDPPIHSQ